MKAEETKQEAADDAVEAQTDEAGVEQEAASGEEAAEPEVAEVEVDPVVDLERDLLKWRELAMRTAADLENYRKRMARDREEAVRYANQSLLEDILPVLDNFEMGMDAAAAEEGSMIYVGMDMVRRQFADLLAAQGVDPVELAPGDEFDPTTQEAMAQEPSDEVEAGRVLRVMRRGFRMRDRLLRPATVVVSSGTKESAESGD